jgi:pimeloyl-ACP methyl ester carboxylesterase
LLVGSLSPVVGAEDIAELRRRQPAAQVEVVEGAGHSIQGDRPLELAARLEAFLQSS